MTELGNVTTGEPSGSKGKAMRNNFQHPTYTFLIHNALSTLRQRGGSSATAIRKSIEQKMGPQLGPNYKKIVTSTLSKLAKTGKLVKTGNTFKLTREFKQQQLKKGVTASGKRVRSRVRKRKPRRRRFKQPKLGRGRKVKPTRRRWGRGRWAHGKRLKKVKSPKRRIKTSGKKSKQCKSGADNDSACEKKVRHASHVHIHQGDKSDKNAPLNKTP